MVRYQRATVATWYVTVPTSGRRERWIDAELMRILTESKHIPLHMTQTAGVVPVYMKRKAWKTSNSFASDARGITDMQVCYRLYMSALELVGIQGHSIHECVCTSQKQEVYKWMMYVNGQYVREPGIYMNTT